MSYCPSQDWDRYCAMTEPAEECPQCGGDNLNEETEEPAFAEAPDFCSRKCLETFIAAEAKAEADVDDADSMQQW